MKEPERSEHWNIGQRFIDGRTEVVDVAVGPDGTQVAYVVATTDVAKNTTRTRVWIGTLDGTGHRPLTGGEHDRSPAWSPDGSQLAFVSRRSEKQGESTLHVMPMHGPGEVRTIATMPDGVVGPRWSPDGSLVAFTSRTRHERYDAESPAWQSPRKIERFFSRSNGEDWIVDRPSHVYVVRSDGTGEPRNLTEGHHEHHGLSWLSDSSGIVTSAARHETWDTDLAVDLYRVDLDGTISALTDRSGTYQRPVVSPDGTRVAFLGSDGAETFPQHGRVGVLDVSGGPHRWVSEALDRTFTPLLGGRDPVWLDDDHVLATVEDRGEQHLHRVDASGARAPEAITSGPRSVGSFDARGGRIAMAVGTVDHPFELVVDDEPITAVSAAFCAEAQPRDWEKFAVATTDGTGQIDAWIMRPTDFDESQTYPVLLNVHGGPMAQYGESFFDEAQTQAAAGYVVLLCNPRGSTGRDEAWVQAIMGPDHPVAPGGGWGSLDVDDLLAVLDAALDRYTFCDRDRVGMLGGSYGGWMATWLAGNHGERFRAICSERAVNNMISEQWSSDIGSSFRAQIGPTYLEDPEMYQRMSPVRFAPDIEIPMLIIHAEDDLRCPINQAEELFTALRLLGKDVTFYRFPGENHELSRSGSPLHRVQRIEILLDFFGEHLTG